MEPMTLGSAPSSPSSPGANPNFLPAFLMGDTSQPATPNANSTSPGRIRSQGRKLAASSTPDPRSLYPKLFNQTIDSPKQQFTPHKPGPPSQGLFDTIEQKRKPSSPILQSTAIDSPGVFGRSRLVDDSFNQSRTCNDSVNLSRMDRIDTHWVTVFGFPPSAVSIVLAQMTNCGVIVDKKVPSQGNWLHIKYNNLSDVPRALAMNGRCINNNIMIGVKLYYHKENKENDEVYTSPIRARSLRHSYVSPQNANSVLPPQNVPQKSTGLVSKAIEYVFGW